MNQTTPLNFAGQDFYLGIDTHKANWRVTVRSNSMELKTFSMNPSPEEMIAHMTRTYPGGSYFSVYEAGYSGYWAHRKLVNLGIKNIIVNAADVPTTDKEKDRKDDPIDSRKLSRELNNGSLAGIYVPDEYHESIRVLSRALRQYGSRNIQVKNRIKALLGFLGIPCSIDSSERWSRAYIKKISEIEFKQAENKFVMKCHLDELDHIKKQRLSVLREIRRISKTDSTIKALRSIPGIGTITAFTLHAELVNMDRFPGLDEVASFVGLVPSTASSDTKVIMKGMTHRHSRYLRYMLIEAAWVAIRMDPVFTKKYHDLCKHMSKQRSIVRIAKKLLNRIRAVWKSGQEYAIGTVETIKQLSNGHGIIIDSTLTRISKCS